MIPTDPSSTLFHQGSPRDTESKVNKHITKLSCSVINFVDFDDDTVKVPKWILNRLKLKVGQPLCVQLHKKPGQLYFYDAQGLELEPTTPNYFQLEEAYRTNPSMIHLRVREALRRYKMLAVYSEIELLIDGLKI